MNRKVFCILSIISCLALGLSSQETFAQDNSENEEYDKFRLSLGWFNPSAETTIRLDATNSSLGTTIKFEDDVGLDRGRGLFRADGFFRFKKKHRIDFAYYDFERNGTETISAVINWGDQTFPVSATLNSFFNVRVIKLSYTYLIVAKRNTTVGLSIGFNITDVEIGLSAANSNLAQTTSSNVPLPVLGIHLTHHLGENFWLEAHSQVLYFKAGSLDGTLFDNRIAVNYRITKNFGLGVGYNFFSFKLTRKNPHFTGQFKLKFDGVQVFASLFF